MGCTIWCNLDQTLSVARMAQATDTKIMRTEGESNTSPANDLAGKIYFKCMDAGLSFKISQGCVLTLSPPLTISREDLDRALSIVEEAIRDA